jgi:hypothetical protein
VQPNHISDIPRANIIDITVNPRVWFAHTTNVINLTDLGTLIVLASEHDYSTSEVEKGNKENGIQECTV